MEGNCNEKICESPEDESDSEKKNILYSSPQEFNDFCESPEEDIDNQKVTPFMDWET